MLLRDVVMKEDPGQRSKLTLESIERCNLALKSCTVGTELKALLVIVVPGEAVAKLYPP